MRRAEDGHVGLQPRIQIASGNAEKSWHGLIRHSQKLSTSMSYGGIFIDKATAWPLRWTT